MGREMDFVRSPKCAAEATIVAKASRRAAGSIPHGIRGIERDMKRREERPRVHGRGRCWYKSKNKHGLFGGSSSGWLEKK